MSILQTENIFFDSSGNNKISYSSGNLTFSQSTTNVNFSTFNTYMTTGGSSYRDSAITGSYLLSLNSTAPTGYVTVSNTDLTLSAYPTLGNLLVENPWPDNSVRNKTGANTNDMLAVTTASVTPFSSLRSYTTSSNLVINDLTFGNNIWVAVGDNAAIQTSSDGLTWTDRVGAFGSLYNYESVAYGNGVFVSVGSTTTANTPAIQSSTDGVTWTARTTANSYNPSKVVYGNGVFVIIGYPSIQSSTNGTTWNNRTSANSGAMNDIAYGNGVFVIVGFGTQSSTDGTTWTNRTRARTDYQNQEVSYGNGFFLTGGTFFNIIGNTIMEKSTNGTTWATYNYPFGGLGGFGAQCVANTFWTLRDIYSFGISLDGTNWVTRNNTAIGTIAYGQDKIISTGSQSYTTFADPLLLVAVGSGGAIQTSTDGTAWTNRTTANTNQMNGIAYGYSSNVGAFGELLVAVGNAGAIQSSTDGITWTNRTTANTNNMNAVTYGNGFFGNGTFVAVGGAGAIQTSTDGITWTNRTTANTNIMYGVTYGNNVYVAVGAAGAIQSSTNGTAWTNRTTANTNQMNAVAYGNGVYVAVGASGAIQSSTDGTTWANRTTANTNNMNGVAYSVLNGLFVATGNSGAIQTSTNGTTWTNKTTANTNTMRGIAYHPNNNVLIMVGNTGSIQYYSPDGISYDTTTTFKTPPYQNTYFSPITSNGVNINIYMKT